MATGVSSQPPSAASPMAYLQARDKQVRGNEKMADAGVAHARHVCVLEVVDGDVARRDDVDAGGAEVQLACGGRSTNGP